MCPECAIVNPPLVSSNDLLGVRQLEKTNIKLAFVEYRNSNSGEFSFELIFFMGQEVT